MSGSVAPVSEVKPSFSGRLSSFQDFHCNIPRTPSQEQATAVFRCCRKVERVHQLWFAARVRMRAARSQIKDVIGNTCTSGAEKKMR